MRIFRWVMVLAAVLALTAWACGGGDDDDGNGGDGNVDVTDACAGDLPGDLPDDVSEADEGDFPDDLPIYDGADFECGFSGEDTGTGLVGVWSTDDSVEDVKAFYDEELSGDGPWTSQSDGTSADSSFWAVTHEDDGQGGLVTVLSDGDNTAITVVISDDLGDISGGDETPTGSAGDEPTPDDGATGSGSEDLPDEVDLPDGFPSDDVPLPDDARVTGASSFSTGGVTSFIVEVYSQDSIDDLAAFFKSEFEGQGWTQVVQTNVSGEIVATYAENADVSGTVVNISITESSVDGYNTVGLSVTAQ